jgi:glycosyltransferase involved in cell wall biosynthesis
MEMGSYYTFRWSTLYTFQWQELLDQIDYKICMSRYGQLCMEEEFERCEESWYIPHGVDCNFFKPILEPKYGKKPLKDIADGMHL